MITTASSNSTTSRGAGRHDRPGRKSPRCSYLPLPGGARAPDEAAGMAVGTAGSAVVFAVPLVIIALAALTIVSISSSPRWACRPRSPCSSLARGAHVHRLSSACWATARSGPRPRCGGQPSEKGRPRREAPPRRPTMGNRWIRCAPRRAWSWRSSCSPSAPCPTRCSTWSSRCPRTPRPTWTPRSAVRRPHGRGFGERQRLPRHRRRGRRQPDARPLARAGPGVDGAGEPVDRREAAVTSSYLYTVGQLKNVGGVQHAAHRHEPGHQRRSPGHRSVDTNTTQVSTCASKGQIADATGRHRPPGLTAVQWTSPNGSPGRCAVPGHRRRITIFLLLGVFRSVMVPLVAASASSPWAPPSA